MFRFSSIFKNQVPIREFCHCSQETGMKVITWTFQDNWLQNTVLSCLSYSLKTPPGITRQNKLGFIRCTMPDREPVCGSWSPGSWELHSGRNSVALLKCLLLALFCWFALIHILLHSALVAYFFFNLNPQIKRHSCSLFILIHDVS